MFVPELELHRASSGWFGKCEELGIDERAACDPESVSDVLREESVRFEDISARGRDLAAKDDAPRPKRRV